MAAPGRSLKSEKDLSERQHYWLKHIRTAECAGEPLKTYAKRLGLSEHSMYETKRRLRSYGLIAPATARKAQTALPRFTRVAVERREASPGKLLRIRLARSDKPSPPFSTRGNPDIGTSDFWMALQAFEWVPDGTEMKPIRAGRGLRRGGSQRAPGRFA